MLVERLRPDDVVIDIGAGTGRHTILFAQACRRVVAVEPSAAMRAHLTQRIREEGLDNVEVVDAVWPSRGALEGDIVFSSHVLYGVEDAAAFLSAMDAVARRLCALVLGISAPSDALAPLWHRVHGVEMPRRPAALEALNLLYQLGVPASLSPLPESARPVSLRTSEDEIAQLCSRLSLEPCAANVARVRAAVATLATTDADDGYRVGTRGPNALVWWAPRGVPW